MNLNLSLVLSFLLALQCAVASRIRDYIYQTLDARYGCFKIMNGTHEFGCSGSISGNTGVIYVVNTTADLQRLMKSDADDVYIVVLHRKLFTVANLEKMEGLASKPDRASVNGVILAFSTDKSSTDDISEFSEDTTCPNHLSGFYQPDKHRKQFNYCLDKPWNPAGNSMLRRHWNFPIILLKNDSQISDIYTCHNKYNTNTSSWPRCSLRLYTPMMAVASSRLCWRRSLRTSISEQMSYCSPLGSSNVLARLGSSSTGAPDSRSAIILVSARLDGATVFDLLSPGADSAVVGMVTVLAVADTLTRMARANDNDALAVMFALFSGESFGYIGSERFVYDAINNNNNNKITGFVPRRVDLDNISHVIELGQLAASKRLTIHSDPVTRQAGTEPQVDSLIKALKDAAADQLNISDSSDGVPLPPSSLHTLLKARANLPGVLISDHDTSYTNRFYHSVYDTGDFIGWTGNKSDETSIDLVNHITAIAKTVADTVYKISTNQSSPKVEVNASWVSELLDCYLIRSNCSAFLRVLDPTLDSHNHRQQWLDDSAPIPTYVSVSVSGTKHWYLTRLTANLLASVTGERLANVSSQEECKPASNEEEYVYRWLLDRSLPVSNSTGYCVRSVVWLTPAVSPAFSIPDYDWSSGRFSTWSESRWLEFSLQMFLVPSALHQWLHLVAGLLTTLLLSVFMIMVVRHSDAIFLQPSDDNIRSMDTTTTTTADRSYGTVDTAPTNSPHVVT